ncbi:MAG: hypothetical protein ACLQPD_12465 [Desulfomonilaceae bacterium]
MPDQYDNSAAASILICEGGPLPPGASPKLSKISPTKWLAVLLAIEDAADWGVS